MSIIEKLRNIKENMFEYLQEFVGIGDPTNELFKNIYNREMEIIDIIAKNYTYLTDLEGISVIKCDEVHEHFWSIILGHKGLGSKIPNGMCIGAGMRCIDPKDTIIIVNSAYEQADKWLQAFILLHEMGHIVYRDAHNEMAADRFAISMMKEKGVEQLKRLIGNVENACKDYPDTKNYVTAVKMRLTFI